MHIILDDYGIQLNKEEQMFTIKLGEQVRSLSPVKVTAIHIYKAVQLSSAALLLAAENDIPVLLYDSHYKPVVRLWNSNFSSTGQVRVMQPVFCNSNAGMYWCIQLVTMKLSGQAHNLRWFINRFTAAKEALEKSLLTIKGINETAAQMPRDLKLLNTLRGYEGAATAAYWQGLDAVLDDAVFSKRMQRSPKDPFNACVNYLYGVLYGKVEGALLAYGLDPMVGLMHTEGYSKKSLVYDCIEPFRHWAELLLVTLFRNGALTSLHFKYEQEKLSLEKEGRKILITSFNEFMLEKTVMNNRRITRNDQLTALCSSLAQAVKNHNTLKP